jgi:hypothetical protein
VNYFLALEVGAEVETSHLRRPVFKYIIYGISNFSEYISQTTYSEGLLNLLFM